MKKILSIVTLFLILSCNEKSPAANVQDEHNREITRLEKENDSLRRIVSRETTVPPAYVGERPEAGLDPVPSRGAKAGVHPISLHWLGWDNPGRATVTPATGGWYLIEGSHQTSTSNYLKIKGKIRRLSAKELEFDGMIETTTETNFEGKPCVKKGLQRFFGKGERTYYRLQNMENCMGGMVVDYVDIYPGTSGL